jgi:hypothetical protein
MKAITKYKAVDGTEFSTEKQCLDYEKLIKNIEVIMSELPVIPKKSMDFVNGHGYIQHDKKILRKVQVKLLELMKKYMKHEWIQQTIDDESIHPSYVGRLVSDSGISPFYHAWSRFSCVDKNSREWGQPYYASHPEEASGQDCIASFSYFKK